MHQVHMEQLDHISNFLDHAYRQYTLTGSILSPMVPPLREALLKFHALMSGTIKDLRHFRQQKLRAIEKFKRQGLLRPLWLLNTFPHWHVNVGGLSECCVAICCLSLSLLDSFFPQSRHCTCFLCILKVENDKRHVNFKWVQLGYAF